MVVKRWWQLGLWQFKENLPQGCRIFLHIRCQNAKSVRAWIIFGKRKPPSLTEACPVLLGSGATWTGWCMMTSVPLFLLLTETWKQLPLPLSVITADAHPWPRNFRQVFPSWKQSLCAAFLEVAQFLSRHKKNASCSFPWEDQVEYVPKILPPPCFTITVKIWNGEAAVKLLISTLMTTSAFLRFHLICMGLQSQLLSCNSAELSVYLWFFRRGREKI